MAGKAKLKIEQGATFRHKFIWSAGTPPVPVDLTGCIIRMQVRSEIKSKTVLLELTTENGGILLEPLLGSISLYISATDTAEFTWTQGVWDLEIEYTDGTVKRLLKGSVLVDPEVTRVD